MSFNEFCNVSHIDKVIDQCVNEMYRLK